jgi:hypothetical protein
MPNVFSHNPKCGSTQRKASQAMIKEARWRMELGA